MKIDQKLLRIMGLVAGGIIIFIIIIALISSCTKNKKYTLEEMESKLVSLSKRYYELNESSLPADGEETSLTTGYFITNGDFKHLTLTTGETCSGEIKVSNNNGYYLYTPALTCGSDIIPVTLTEKITDKSNIVATGEGLYNYGSNYIFRGENVNNYLLIDEGLWRIIKVNSDNTIRIIQNKKSDTSSWDNRYNIEKKSNTGINDFIVNNISSRIKDKLESLYNNELYFPEEIRGYFTKQDLCVGKRSINDNINDGTIECATIVEDQVFGLIQTNEFIQASLDPNCNTLNDISCTNYNYLARLESSTWTITADKDTNHKAFKLDYGISISNTSGTSGVSVVAHLSDNVLFNGGDGSQTNPYIIK